MSDVCELCCQGDNGASARYLVGKFLDFSGERILYTVYLSPMTIGNDAWEERKICSYCIDFLIKREVEQAMIYGDGFHPDPGIRALIGSPAPSGPGPDPSPAPAPAPWMARSRSAAVAGAVRMLRRRRPPGGRAS